MACKEMLVSGRVKKMVAVLFNLSTEEVRKFEAGIKGNSEELRKIREDCDVSLMKKLFKISDAELAITAEQDQLVNSVLCRLATKSFSKN